MAVYNPPTEYNPIFNTSNFITPTTGLTVGQANLLYLSKVNNDSTNASVTSTTFTNTINTNSIVTNNYGVTAANTTAGFLTGLVSGTANICTGLSIGTMNIGTAITSGLINQGKTTFNNATTITDGQQLNTRLIKSTSTVADAHTIFDNMPAGSSITIGNQLGSSSIALKGGVSVGISGTGGGILNLYRKLNIQDINGNNFGYGELYFGSAAELGIYAISLPATLLQTYVRSYNCSAGSTTSILRLEVGDTVKIPGAAEFGTNGVNTTPAYFRTDIRLIEVNSPYSSYSQLYSGGDTMNYIMNAGATTATLHNFYAYNNTNNQRVAFQVGYSQVNITDGVILNARQITSSSNTSTANEIFTNLVSPAVLTVGGTTSSNTIRGDTTFSQNANFNGRLNFTGATYSFPFSSPQSIGYYLKTTGTPYTTLTTATPKTIVSTASIPIGVWIIDFRVTNLVTAAGTITQSQTYISPTLDGAVGTAVNFTGSVIRSHVSEVYAISDVQDFTGSFTYQQTTAGVLRLNIVKSFGTGTYSFTGEIAITRIA